jgi:3-oxoacyl-[acyl-carrier-protein] synthase-3
VGHKNLHRKSIFMIEILGTGSYLPPAKLKNKELEQMVDTSAKWIEDNLGIKERRIATGNMKTSDMATWAGHAAIEDAGLSVRDIDLLIVATATPDKLAPSTACMVQNRLGCYNAVAFDVNAVCSGYLYAMDIVASMIFRGPYNKALVIGVDMFSKITDWTRRDCVFFGDGAGATVFGLGDSLLSIRLYSDGRGNGFSAPHDGCYDMDGRAVYNKAVSELPVAIEHVLEEAEITIDDIDLMIPHQPSIRILKETAKRIGLPWGKVMTNMDRYANTAAGTIPILLDEVRKDGKLKGNVLFAAMGAGWTWGAAILKI